MILVNKCIKLNYTIDKSKIQCDYFEYLADKNMHHPSAYMLQYEWAELK